MRTDLEPLQYTIIFEDERLPRELHTAYTPRQLGPIDRFCQDQSHETAALLLKQVSPSLTEEARGQVGRLLSELQETLKGTDDPKVLFGIGKLLWCHGAGLMLSSGKPRSNKIIMVSGLRRTALETTTNHGAALAL